MVVVTHETHMSKQVANVFPAGELAGVDHDAGQVVMRVQPGICRQFQRIKVLGSEGIDLDHENLGVGKKAVGDAGSFG